jgi:hypothetical protein
MIVLADGETVPMSQGARCTTEAKRERRECTELVRISTGLLQQLKDNSRTIGSHHFRSDIPPALEKASEGLRMGFSWLGGDPMCDLALPPGCPRLANQPEVSGQTNICRQNAEFRRILTTTTCIYIIDVDDA